MFHIGWDVGAWNCDRNKSSRDALVVLLDHGSNVSPEWAGGCLGVNLRSELEDRRGVVLISSLLRRCCVQPGMPVRTIAIDTPLGWPAPMRKLLATGKTASIPERADENPYIFRQTELRLFKAKQRPLSAVRDQIGSQSTKGIHFLAKIRAQRSSVGVWESRDNSGAMLSVIETYPTPCKESSIVCAKFEEIIKAAGARRLLRTHPRFRSDLEDAVRCAVIAWLYANVKSKLQPPTENIPSEEGWIWIPGDLWGAPANS